MTRGDKLLIIIIVLISIFSLVLISKGFFSANARVVSIEVDGELYQEINLDSNFKDKIIEVESEYGRNVIKIENGGVRVIEASCPDKLDVKQGEITRVGEMIICLPNRLVVEIKGMKSEMEVDKISR